MSWPPTYLTKNQKYDGHEKAKNGIYILIEK